MHFKKLTSPLLAICGGYIYITILGLGLYEMDFYNNSTFFTWGTPVNLMGIEVEDNTKYYLVLFLFFIYQLINNWINEVTYPWIINCIQDPKARILGHSRGVSMLIVNMFSIYSEINVIINIAGIMCQISFFIVIILANLISVSIINWQYIKRKKNIKLYIPLNSAIV